MSSTPEPAIYSCFTGQAIQQTRSEGFSLLSPRAREERPWNDNCWFSLSRCRKVNPKLLSQKIKNITGCRKLLQSWTKLLKHLANFHLFSQQSSVLQPPPPYFNVVNALLFLKQSLSNRKPQETTLSRGGGG